VALAVAVEDLAAIALQDLALDAFDIVSVRTAWVFSALAYPDLSL